MKPIAFGLVTWVGRLEWLLVLAAAPLFLFPAREHILALLVLPALLSINTLVWRRALPLTPFNLPLLLLTLMVLVSLWATTDLNASLPKIAGLLYGLLVFFTIVVYSQNRRGWAAALRLFCLVGVGIAGLSLIGTNWFTTKFPALNPIIGQLPMRFSGLSGAEGGFQPNEVAGALIWVIPVMAASACAVLRRESPLAGLLLRGVWFVVLGVSATFSTGVLILTQSRGGYIGILLAGLCMIFLALPRRARWVALVLIVIAAAAGGLFISRYGLQGLLERISDPTVLDNPAYSISSLNGRIEIWSRAVAGLKDFGLTGMGMNRFRTIIYLLYPYFGISYNDNLGHAHNEFLQAGLDLGLPGLVAFLSLYLVAFWMLVQTWNWAKEPAQLSDSRSISSILASSRGVKVLTLGLGGGLLAHAFYGLTDAVALGAKPGVLFWMLLGLVAGLYQEQRKLREQDITT